MTLIKRIIALISVLCLVLSLFPGCTPKNGDESDDNTLTINLIASSSAQIVRALETEFPDINFIVNRYAGANTSRYQKEQLVRGQGGDIFFYTTFFNSDDVGEYLVDLSGYSFLANYDKSILSTLDINGAIYQIPGPITVRYVGVNKTLFEEKGWKIPETFEETVEVCKQIKREAPDIVPLGVGALSLGFVWTLVTSYAQMGYLDTTEGRNAEENFRNGTASFGDAFDEGLDMVAQLVDAGAFTPDKFSDTWNITPEQMCSREAAMCYVMCPNESHTMLFSGASKGNTELGEYCNDEFIALPLYGKNPKNKGLILAASNTWGISKYLENPGNEKKFENAMRVLEYISSARGQFAIRYEPAAIPAIKNLQSDYVPPYMKELWNDSTNSIKSFFLYTGYEHVMIETGTVLLDAMKAGSSEGMKEKFISLADRLNREYIEKEASSGAFGYCQDDLSVEQTRRVCCEAIANAAQCEIAIASESDIKNGAENRKGLAGNLFKGDIVGECLTMIVGNSKATVVTVPLTGGEIKELLENGKTLKNTQGGDEIFEYWASGLEVSRKEGKITRITAKGKPLDVDAVYTVAMLEEDYSEGFELSHSVTETEMRIIPALENYFKVQGRIKAEN